MSIFTLLPQLIAAINDLAAVGRDIASRLPPPPPPPSSSAYAASAYIGLPRSDAEIAAAEDAAEGFNLSEGAYAVGTEATSTADEVWTTAQIAAFEADQASQAHRHGSYMRRGVPASDDELEALIPGFEGGDDD